MTYDINFNAATSTRWRHEPGLNAQMLITMQMWASEKLRAKGYLFLNDVLDFLGMDGVREGQTSGWYYEHWATTVTFGMPKDENFDAFVEGRVNDIMLRFNCMDGILDMVWPDKNTA